MSQHLFKTQYQGRPVTIQMGWDRPLQGYYLVIERTDEEDDEYAYLYSNLDDDSLANPHPSTLDHFLSKLRELEIDLPKAMVEGVLADGAANVGNKVVEY